MHNQTDQRNPPMRAGHAVNLASRVGSGGNVRSGVSPDASTLSVHAAYGSGTFCTRQKREKRAHYLDVLDHPKACKRCLAEIAKYRRRWPDLRPNTQVQP